MFIADTGDITPENIHKKRNIFYEAGKQDNNDRNTCTE